VVNHSFIALSSFKELPYMRSKLCALTAAAATTFTVVACPNLAAEAASSTQDGSCVDGGGRTWSSRVVWGDEYSDSAGVRRVRVDSAAWTTNGRIVPTDAAVRTYDGGGTRLQRLKWTGRHDYLNGTSWLSWNPADPPSAPGKARVAVTLGIDGDGLGNCTKSFVQPSGATTTTTEPATTVTASGGWVSDQSAVPLGGAGCSAGSGTVTAVALRKEWDYWDNCGGAVVSVAAEGLPATPWGGDRVFRWHKPAGDSQVYQKLNRTLTKDNWPGGSAGPVPNTGSPADASGIYTVWQYIPSDRFRLNPGHGWVILSSFKENYTDSAGAWRQDPTWGLGCNNFSGPITCSLTPHDSPRFSLSAYMNRWVKWEYRMYQGAKDTTGHGGRIELWADGTLLDTGYESQRHVGSAAFAPLSSTRSWVWIAGQYTSNQSTGGIPDYQNTDATSYLGRSSITPLQ
jgi:hypothetical protein